MSAHRWLSPPARLTSRLQLVLVDRPFRLIARPRATARVPGRPEVLEHLLDLVHPQGLLPQFLLLEKAQAHPGLACQFLLCQSHRLASSTHEASHEPDGFLSKPTPVWLASSSCVSPTALRRARTKRATGPMDSSSSRRVQRILVPLRGDTPIITIQGTNRDIH